MGVFNVGPGLDRTGRSGITGIVCFSEKKSLGRLSEAGEISLVLSAKLSMVSERHFAIYYFF